MVARLMLASSLSTVSPRRTRPILERELEVGAIDHALTQVLEGSGTAIVIRGQAGVGMSTLLHHAADEATRRGIRVLRARGGELERALPYGIVTELFGTFVREDRGGRELFAGPAHIAARLFGDPMEDRDGTNGEPADPVAYLHGLIWLVLNVAEHEPLAIMVDDAHWADEPSLRFLHRLVDRIGEVPVVVLLAMGSAGDGPASALADRIRTHRSAIHISPKPLSEAAVGEVMSDTAGWTVSDDLRRAAWTTTGGNPFFVNEVASELARAGAGMGAAEVATFLPQRIGRYVDARLLSAGANARAVAEAVAVLGDHATLHRCARLAGMESVAVEGVTRSLSAAGILDDSAVLAFRQPIVRRAIEVRIPGSIRAEMHRRAALILADESADPGIIGALLRDAAPSGDPRVVELLVAAAADALRRGEAGTAAGLLRRALDEPPDPGARPEILQRLARAEAAAGLPSAPATFADAVAAAGTPVVRAGLQLELGHALIAAGQWPAAAAVLKRALEDAPGTDDELRGRLEASYLAAAWVSMDEDRAVIGDRVRQLLGSDELGAANRQLAVWVAFQQGAVVESTASEMGALVKRVFTEVPIEELVRQGQVVEVGAGVLLETDELAFEVEVLTAAIETARHRGPIGKVGLYSYCRAWPSYYMGRLADAIADVDEALRAAELGWEAFVPAAVTVAALAHIERDDLDAAQRVLDIEPEQWAGRIDTAMLLPLATGRLALARGDVASALDHFQRAGQGAGAAFMRNNVPTDWRTWYAMALLQEHRRDEARAVAEEGVEIARAWGAEWPLGASLRIAGRVAGGPTGLEYLREAEALLRSSPARLEYARLLMTLGVTLRRNGTLTDARDTLAQAADLAHRIGARAILARATSELRAAGARPRRIALSGVDALTPAELRVANEALAGRTNREIAQALFVTPKAVEFHLANTYRKLDIGSRGQLAAALTAEGRA